MEHPVQKPGMQQKGVIGQNELVFNPKDRSDTN